MKIFQTKILSFLLFALCLFSSLEAFGQNQILRTCPGASPARAQAKVTVTKDGAINLITCSGQSVLLNGVVLAGTGTVTSAALSLPNIFTVSGSPITTSGTLSATLANQTGNVIFGSPSNGSSGSPLFRSLVAADIPTALPGLVTVGTITSGTWSGSFGAVSGANLTTLNASNLSSGTVATARLGTGTADSTTYLRGDGTWQVLSSSSTFTSGSDFVDLTFDPSVDVTSIFRYEGRSANLIHSSNAREFQTLDNSTNITFAVGDVLNNSVLPLTFRQYYNTRLYGTSGTLTVAESGSVMNASGGTFILPTSAGAGTTYTFFVLAGAGTGTVSFPSGQILYHTGTNYTATGASSGTVTTPSLVTIVSVGSNSWLVTNLQGTFTWVQ